MAGGYTMQSGRWANTQAVTLLSDATASVTGSAVELGDRGTLCLTLTVSAEDDSAGDTDLDVVVQTSEDGTTWRALGTFATISAAGSERKSFVGCDRYVRAVATLTPDSITAWAAATAYSEGDLVTNGGKVYVCVTAGTSASGPSGTEAGIADGTVEWDYINPSAWQAETPYAEGAYVSNDGGKIYRCITAGTSASSGGPTGTGADITDGTVHWEYVAVGTWSAGDEIALDDVITADSGKLYVAVTAGTTAAGPSGTGEGIADGSAEWDYVPAPSARMIFSVAGEAK